MTASLHEKGFTNLKSRARLKLFFITFLFLLRFIMSLPYPPAARSVAITFKLNDDEASALAQMCKRFTSDHAKQLSNRAVPNEQQNMLDALEHLRAALQKAGFEPR